jgi:hypothetical protein
LITSLTAPISSNLVSIRDFFKVLKNKQA